MSTGCWVLVCLIMKVFYRTSAINYLSYALQLYILSLVVTVAYATMYSVLLILLTCYL